jgi:hypothetical protein
MRIEMLVDKVGKTSRGKVVYAEKGDKLKYSRYENSTVIMAECKDSSKGKIPLAITEENKTFKYI